MGNRPGRMNSTNGSHKQPDPFIKIKRVGTPLFRLSDHSIDWVACGAWAKIPGRRSPAWDTPTWSRVSVLLHFPERILETAPDVLFHIPLADAHIAPHPHDRDLPALYQQIYLGPADAQSLGYFGIYLKIL